MVLIENREYYCNAKMWRFIPEEIFNAMELSEIEGSRDGIIRTKVSRIAFEQMLNDYNNHRND